MTTRGEPDVEKTVKRGEDDVAVKGEIGGNKEPNTSQIKFKAS